MESRVDLWWLPVGAGGHVVVHTSRWWELLAARREHRRPEPLFHAALEVFVDSRRYVIEMTPAWGQPRADRGVAVTGPVGLRPLGRLRAFRYEVRAWQDGILSDRASAVDSPVTIRLDAARARALRDDVSRVPALTWGRRVPEADDMWNSNALISWLLTRRGLVPERLHPPAGGRAPGWVAGIAVAMRPPTVLEPAGLSLPRGRRLPTPR
ncbi:MAG: hypothetical protein J0I70_03120 [Microbacterium sp.]|uniref:hypothetical protein n=1 Tax=Microbacterium sp. TaxID=51671 RepID=UPI001AC6DD98|nr:hypothetical protein [Microbacterium sp.]MBN9154602.1 hypothetical protein [Microbacterium sp.]MBN9171451.1 hypothetical protein [Microbacterium sp.]MBN9173130.1 hypothetical protein [Microbacterium sp.]